MRIYQPETVDKSFCLPKLKTIFIHDFSTVDENFPFSLLCLELYD